MSARDDRRRRAAAVMLVPGERERRSYLMRGFDPDRVVATGYVKASFRQRTFTRPVFPDARPVVLYAPHWQAHRSSWPAWGEAVVCRLADDGRFNAILAPHQRLVETAPEVRDVLASVAGRPNVHVDLDSFALVDGSYTEAADIYLGDTSSQVVEFLVRPRPCVFLNPDRVAWQGDPAYDQWRCGEVVEALDEALPALARANPRHPAYAAIQADFARSSLGDLSAEAPRRAARQVLRAAGLQRRSVASRAA
jgi:CDP-glycerol glycerophosphotransferase (TagB/SpsB family)